jgi:hypothetical protein
MTHFRHPFQSFITVLILSCISFGQLFAGSGISLEDSIKGVKIQQLFPEMDEETGKLLLNDPSSAEVYQSGKINLYLLEYQFESIDYNTQKVILSEMRYHYVIHSIDSLYGYDYDVHKKPSKRRVLVDSLLNWKWISKINIYPMLTVNIPKLISQKSNRDSGTLREWYAYSNEDTSIHGTMFFEYSTRLRDIRFSLSKQLDSIKNMKLHEARLSIDSRFIKKLGKTYDKMEMSFKLSEIQTVRPEIRSLINEYQATVPYQ